jgi:DNA adenine methylase
MEYTNGYTFLKWAGAKSKLLSQLIEYLPQNIDTYYEPFLGSGAMLFYILHTYNVKKAYVSDINAELINTFIMVKEKPHELIELLKEYQNNHSKEYYYKIRDEVPKDKLKLAARFIYLNKTCFNGLYRVNSKGLFNVPIGSYKSPTILQEDKIMKASKILKNVEFSVGDYNNIISKVKKGDFVYLDPPYYPLEDKTSFTKYAKGDFTEKDQKELKLFCDELTRKKVNFLESNSYTKYIQNIYKNYNQNEVLANRMINCKATGRGKIKELVIYNYEVDL